MCLTIQKIQRLQNILLLHLETTNLNDLLNFELNLLDGEAKPIKFAATEQKTPALTFTIQVIK